MKILKAIFYTMVTILALIVFAGIGITITAASAALNVVILGALAVGVFVILIREWIRYKKDTKEFRSQ